MKNSLLRLNIIFLASAALLFACGKGDNKQSHPAKTYVVKAENLHKSLYFTGTIQPLKESTITCPVDAAIDAMYYQYGQRVKAGDVVVKLSSGELQKQYNETLTDYLKAKDTFTIAKAKFTGTQELWDAGLLSKNNFLSEKSSLDTARINLMQSTRKLTEMLEKVDDKSNQKLSNLSIAEFEKVREALASQHQFIHLKSPDEGVLLYPPKSSDDKSGRLSIGSSIKAGQVIALVGDLSGVRIEIDVPEIDITKIHTGMKAEVSGIALGRQTLHGKLVAVNGQASMASGGALPSFSAVVEVNHLTPEQRALVKVGMSASIQLSIDSEKPFLQVPIESIKQEKGKSLVMVKNAKGIFEKRMVITGAAQADKVVIDEGLKEGDVIAYG